MGFYVFGSGTAIAKPFGALAAGNPTPLQLATLQEVSVDISASQKELMGKQQFPVAIARTAGKVNIKIKWASFYAKALNDLFFGSTVSTGQRIGVIDEAHTAAASVTITPPSSGTFVEDQGVVDASANQMTKAASNPPVGSYSVNEGTGAYTFNASQTGTLLISYVYSITGGAAVSVANKPMGSMPIFEMWLHNSQYGNNISWRFPNCILSKIALNFKNEDWGVPDVEGGAFSDASGNIFYQYSDL
jgi:hypothetical protein